MLCVSGAGTMQSLALSVQICCVGIMEGLAVGVRMQGSVFPLPGVLVPTMFLYQIGTGYRASVYTLDVFIIRSF